MILEETLQQKREQIEKLNNPELKDNFKLFHTSFQNLYTTLLRKSFIQEDPYKYEHKISEVTIPPSGPVTESDKINVISQRLSLFNSQLDFLNNYYQFSIEFLNLSRIKKLVSLIKYILWNNLSESSTNTNTHIVAEFFEKLKQGDDTLSSGLITDAQGQMEKCSKEILNHLKELTVFHRESYKLLLRKELFSKINLKSEDVISRKEDVLQLVKRKFAQEFTKKPFYPELVKEILDEDFAQDSIQLRNKTLARLKVKKEKPKQQKEISYKDILLNSIRLLAASGAHLNSAIGKLNQSSLLLEETKKKHSNFLKQILEKLLKTDKQEQLYDIDFFDEKTSSNRSVKINFKTLSNKIQKKARFIGALQNKMNPAYRELENSEESRIFSLLTKNLNDIQEMLYQFPALDIFFKTELPQETRKKVRDIQIEIDAIKTCLIKARQKRHEYVSRKEEIEQMKKLGINTDVS